MFQCTDDKEKGSPLENEEEDGFHYLNLKKKKSQSMLSRSYTIN